MPITFTSCIDRLGATAESMSRCVCTIVSTLVAVTIRWRIEYDESARTNSVFSSGSLGIARVDADDEVDARLELEPLRDPRAPVRAETGDEDAVAHVAYPNQTLLRAWSMSCTASWIAARIRSDCSMTTLRL